MPSLLPGYEYDIFISYRHNDNKSGWVTEFLKNLQEELAATIKEPVSVYFDSNPHDGILETHNVDKSLEGKLKCLIFIPILSQTYCDPKSFAWQNELCAFNKLTKEDKFGRDIKLGNGNVASRILPIKIHDLDAEDKAAIENEIGGALRAIEFIYKESGVNRPLKSTDNKSDNQNKTDYRNQINKVANAVKEIIIALKSPSNKIIELTREKSFISPDNAKKFSKKKIAFATISLMIVLALTYGVHQLVGSSQEESQVIDKSIAVFPFVNMSNDPEQEYFSEGIMEEILNQLTKIDELKVTSRTSSILYKDSKLSLKEIANMLGVGHILEGSVRKSGDKVRITVQLIDASSDKHLWSETFDREMKDIFTIQTDIATQIAKSLKTKLSLEEQKQIEKKFTENAEAYQLYLRGRYYWNKRTKETLKKGIGYFQQAIEIDSMYSLAYAGLGDSYLMLGVYEVLPPRASFPVAKKYIEKALQLDPKLAEAYATLIDINLHYDWDMEMAENNFRKAIELNPNYAYAYHWHAEVLSIQKQFKSAVQSAQTALKIEPFSIIINAQLGTDFMYAGDMQNSVAQYQKTVEIDSTSALGHYFLGIAYIGLKQFDKALQHLHKAISLDPNNIGILATAAYAEGIAGNRSEAIRIEKDLLKQAQNNYVPSYELAIVELGLGKNEQALHYLEQAFTERGPWMPFLSMNPLFSSLKEDKRFQELVRKIESHYN